MSMDRDHLWAKSKQADEPFVPSMVLPRHLQDVHDAALRVLDATAMDQLGALGLDSNQCDERFRRCVLLAAALHDLGKANDHFQDMICGRRDVRQSPQGLRHEWVSVLLVHGWLQDWLLPAVGGSALDLAIVQWAIGGHHPAYGRASPPMEKNSAVQGSVLTVLTRHRDFQDCLEWLRRRFELGPTPPLPPALSLDLLGATNAFALLHEWLLDALLQWNGLDARERRFAAAVKATLIAADVAGSAVPQANGGFDWLSGRLPILLGLAISKRLSGGGLARVH